MAALDVLVLPSLRSEAASQVIPQALAVGTPVVATHVGGSGEIIRDGDTGRLVPPGDAPALAAALRRLAGDAALRERLAAAGHERWRSHGAPPAAASALRDALRSLTSRS
jgi:glycosyltransferase involved in cell wall biosynthesis